MKLLYTGVLTTRKGRMEHWARLALITYYNKIRGRSRVDFKFGPREFVAWYLRHRSKFKKNDKVLVCKKPNTDGSALSEYRMVLDTRPK